MLLPISQVINAAIKLRVSVINEAIYYLSSMKDNVSTLLVTLSLHFPFTALQLGRKINFNHSVQQEGKSRKSKHLT